MEAAVPAGAAAYGRVCGRTLARAHARSGDRVAIASYLGGSDTFDQALAAFAETYADQNERDYRALQDAVDRAASLPRQASEAAPTSVAVGGDDVALDWHRSPPPFAAHPRKEMR